MKKHRVAWLPGDGIGQDVMHAARIVLDRVGLNAEYVPGDIGWEFWRHEGDAASLPYSRSAEEHGLRLFGAITSKPLSEAAAELDPGIAAAREPVYRSPSCSMRQVLDLYTCLRPCKAYPGNPLNYREGIDLVIFRENTEDLYAGIEFASVPAANARSARDGENAPTCRHLAEGEHSSRI